MTSQTPSCVPQGATLREGSKTLAVYAGEPVLLEATVNAGYNLTFDWSLGDDVTEVADRPADRKCEERACLTSRMVGELFDFFQGGIQYNFKMKFLIKGLVTNYGGRGGLQNGRGGGM